MTEGSFALCLRLLTAEERMEILALIARWSKGTSLGLIVTTNIYSLERFLAPERLRDLLRGLPRGHDIDLVAVETAYAAECIHFVTEGGAIDLKPPPSLVGRVVTRGALVDALASSLNGDKEHAEELLNRLLNGRSPESSERHISMSKWAAWVTWDEVDASADPFRFARGAGPEHILACLGLSFRMKGEDLILLSYRPLPLIRPTVADAGLSAYFQPPREGEPHGWTRPWPADMVAMGAPAPRPRPEAIHERQPLLDLVSIERAR